MKRKLLLFFGVLLPMLFWAQFTINITTVPETCTGDGKAIINIGNTTVGSVFEFVTYKLPNTSTPYRVTNSVIANSTSLSHEEGSLPAGNYSVKINEIRGLESRSQTASFSISNEFKELNFSNDVNYSCGLANITVNVSSGFPISYELRTSAGVVRPPQASNIFNNVPAGTYNVIVTDKCGNTKGLSVTTTAETNNYTFVTATTNQLGFNFLSSCNTYNHIINIRRNGSSNIPVEKFPIQITYKITAPDGSITTRNYTMNNNLENGKLNVTDIPFYYNQAFKIETSLTDACGNTHTQINNIPARTLNPEVITYAGVCGQNYIGIRNYITAPAYKLEFTQYPPQFKPWELNNNFVSGSYSATLTDIPIVYFGDVNKALPIGNYTFKITDACGHVAIRNFTISSGFILRNRGIREGCNATGSVYLQITGNSDNTKVGDITELRVLNGPSSYSNTYPVNIDNAIVNGSAFVGSLPAGTYVFEASNSCGIPEQATVTLAGANIKITSNVTHNCGSFNYSAKITSNVYNPYIDLEHFNENTNTWEKIGTLSRPGAVSNYTGILNNVTLSGKFRTRARYEVYNNGTTSTSICEEIVDTFMVAPGGLSLKNYYTVSCADNTYNLILDAIGIAPLKYEIFEKDDVAFSIDNGIDPVFVNLSEGTYKVRISDNCGNSIIASLRVNRNKLPTIKPSNLCDGKSGKLFIDGLSFMDIAWYKDGIEISPSSTGNNTLNFNPFQSSTNVGLYTAKLSYNPNPNSCIDNFISFNLTESNQDNPNAGVGQTVTLNKNQITSGIDLFQYLNGSYDNYGTWEETTNSNLLVDNEWFGAFANPGTYTFTYNVSGTCSNTATSTVIINLIGACYEEPTTIGDALSTNHGITLLKRAGSHNGVASTDDWPMLRKGAWTVLESNKKGFVVTRMAEPETAITKPKEGMIVYDTTEKCLKIYSDGSWKCYNIPACP
ncbi:UDP-N-acetylglucosamine enolpyruvyl transferase [Riemerella anatipestifer]|uniref:UDP-N-acetylglucosamine enolpyruvyl transferase n=1 Tax=Riemerella anatipestifer TaxID=34085 RepID=UPI0021F82A58|nr:UDP-N-acetylglucosamine enolpyruvyl transferase [Riemerella anatipestifer]MCW0508195.1 UDP-N-acetylglucosamine enolpyruvyl transferase [Riemerella anatipestifer]